MTSGADCLTGLSCLIIAIGSGRGRRVDGRAWWTAYFIFWIGSIVALAATGGAKSPVFGPYMLALLLGGAHPFEKRRMIQIFGFSFFNFLFWGAFTAIVIRSRPMEPWPGLLSFGHDALFVAGAVGVFLYFSSLKDVASGSCNEQSSKMAELEAGLVHCEKMSEVGYLLATTAHELGQPLQVVITASSLIGKLAEEALPESKDVRRLGERIKDASQRVIRLLAQIRDFSRNEPFSMKPCDANEAIRMVEILTQYDLRARNVRYDLQLSDDPVWVEGDSLKLQQVLLNLVNNARDACSGTENARVSLRAERIRDWVRISISNNGPQISLETQAKLFQPYFTTKGRGKGTGLGLSICQQIIDQHGGRIFFSSGPERTVFLIDLPLFRSPALKQTG